MLRADREVNAHLAILAASIECSFHEVLLHRGACAVLIFVELQQTFRQFAVRKTFLAQQGGDGCLHGVVAAVLGDGSLQIVDEGKLVEVVLKLLDELCLFVVVQKLKQVLEHTAGCTRGGHKLQHLACSVQIGIPSSEIVLLLSIRRDGDAIAWRCGSCQFQPWESCFETFQLCIEFLFRNTFLCKEIFVFLCKHG